MYPRHFAARFFISLALFLWPLSPPLKHFLLILLRAISQATNIVNFAVSFSHSFAGSPNGSGGSHGSLLPLQAAFTAACKVAISFAVHPRRLVFGVLGARVLGIGLACGMTRHRRTSGGGFVSHT